MSSRRQEPGARAAARASLRPVLAVLLATLVMCLGYGVYDRGERADAPEAGVSVSSSPPSFPMSGSVSLSGSSSRSSSNAEERLGSPAEDHDKCCGKSAREIRAVLPAAAQPLVAPPPSVPFVPRPAAVSSSPGPPSPRGAPDLHVLQVQRI